MLGCFKFVWIGGSFRYLNHDIAPVAGYSGWGNLLNFMRPTLVIIDSVTFEYNVDVNDTTCNGDDYDGKFITIY